MKINDYTLIAGHSSYDLTRRIQRLIKDGFEPYGTPFLEHYMHGITFYQAMIKVVIKNEDTNHD